MRGVKFGEYHTVEDWNLILNAKSINPPDPKVVKVSVDGRDGDINLSRVLTEDMKYENRPASFTFLMTEGTHSEREELLSEIINVIHGRELKIIEPDKPDYYLLGECEVNNVVNDLAYASFKVVADCEPYYYSQVETSRLVTATTTPLEVPLTNKGRKTLVPTIIVEGEVNISFDSTEVSLSSGTYVLSGLLLKTGVTIVTVKGSGSVRFTYREAVL